MSVLTMFLRGSEKLISRESHPQLKEGYVLLKCSYDVPVGGRRSLKVSLSSEFWEKFCAGTREVVAESADVSVKEEIRLFRHRGKASIIVGTQRIPLRGWPRELPRKVVSVPS